MFWIIWFLIGAATAVMLMNYKWNKGENIDIEALFVAAMVTIGGIMSAIVAIAAYLIDNKQLVIVKGKEKEEDQ